MDTQKDLERLRDGIEELRECTDGEIRYLYRQFKACSYRVDEVDIEGFRRWLFTPPITSGLEEYRKIYGSPSEQLAARQLLSAASASTVRVGHSIHQLLLKD